MIITNGSVGYASNVDHYVFSLETMDPVVFEAIGKANLPRVLDNIRYAASRQKICLNCVQCSSNSPEDVRAVAAFAKELGSGEMVTAH